MSLVSNLQTAFTRVGTEFKSIRTLIGGSGTANISALTTADKTSLVAAVNEIKAAVGAGSPTTLDDLTDVVIATPATGHVIRYNGTNFVNVLGTTYFDAAGAATTAQAAAIAASQPVDTDLTAIAALTTTTYGRAFLALANQAGLMGLVASSSDTVQGIVELATTVEATTGTDTARAVTPAGLKAAIDALIAGAPGALDTLNEIATQLASDESAVSALTTTVAGKQAADADLTAIAALTSAANKVPYATGAGAWALADFSSFGRSLVDDADATAARTTLAVYSTTEVGDPTTDFATGFVAALV